MRKNFLAAALMGLVSVYLVLAQTSLLIFADS